MVDSSHKSQHWVPKSYLAAWCDPDVPDGQQPYVYVFSKNGSDVRRKAPVNIFKETNLYTIKMPDGTRDLRLERGLRGLEQAFCNIRRNVLEVRHSITQSKHMELIVFVASMLVRTPLMRDHHGAFWNEIRSMMSEFTAGLNPSATGKNGKASSATIRASDKHRGLSIEQVANIADNPMQKLLGPFIRAQVPYLLRMGAKVLCTRSDPGFITSDAPVVWFDPEWHMKPLRLQSPGLLDPKLEITMPISPGMMLMLNHGDQGLKYLDVPDFIVSGLNRRTRFYCNNEFVVRRNHVEPEWFDTGNPPDAN